MKEHFSHKMDLVKILDDKWKKDARVFGNQNIIAEKHIDEKLAITFWSWELGWLPTVFGKLKVTGTLMALFFWQGSML